VYEPIEGLSQKDLTVGGEPNISGPAASRTMNVSPHKRNPVPEQCGPMAVKADRTLDAHEFLRIDGATKPTALHRKDLNGGDLECCRPARLKAQRPHLEGSRE
jgi:hypothetical protein